VSCWPSTGNDRGPSPQLSPDPNNEHLVSARQEEGAPVTTDTITTEPAFKPGDKVQDRDATSIRYMGTVAKVDTSGDEPAYLVHRHVDPVESIIGYSYPESQIEPALHIANPDKHVDDLRRRITAALHTVLDSPDSDERIPPRPPTSRSCHRT
jgi:hypothetical protein